MTEPLLRLDGLAVRYAGTSSAALDEVSFALPPGERLAIVGESGSGKSTLALALAGLLPRRTEIRGTVAWPALGHAPMPGRDLGMVFQDPGNSLNPVLRVGEQVAEVAQRHLGLGWPQAYERATQLIEQVRLPDPARVLRAFPHQLSGGQRQRIAIAAAMAARPALLIADEATSALDTIVQRDILLLLDRLMREHGTTLIFVTHDIALAAQFADRIAVFHRGRLMEIGDAGRVTTSPASDYTATLLASHISLTTPPLIGGMGP